MSEKISIVVPIYNSACTLERCLNSLVSQTFANISIILVDDGSVDSSSEICDKYSLIDNRIIVIHKKNEGVSSSRNLGLQKCETKYIMFVDSDDYVEKTICEKLYNSFKSNDSISASCCGCFRKIYKNGKLHSSSQLIPKSKGIFSFNDFKNQFPYLYKSSFVNTVWCKLYDVDLINKINLRFREDISIGEDLLFNLGYLHCSYKMSFVNEALYHYNNYSDSHSLTHEFDEKKVDFLNIEFDETKKFCCDMHLDQHMNIVGMIYLKINLIIIEQFINTKEKTKNKSIIKFVKNLINSPRMLEVLEYGCNNNFEHLLYKWCFKTKSVLIVTLLAHLRILLKKITRGGG